MDLVLVARHSYTIRLFNGDGTEVGVGVESNIDRCALQLLIYCTPRKLI